MIHECYQVWTALDSDFNKHKESVRVPVCVCVRVVLKVTGISI